MTSGRLGDLLDAFLHRKGKFAVRAKLSLRADNRMARDVSRRIALLSKKR